MDLSRISFLVADDSPIIRRLLRAMLAGLGSELVREAANGVEAVEALRHSPADILIADWLMAPMDGLELTRHLRASPDSPDRFQPIIMITGFADRARVCQARDAGVTEFLVKPLSAAALFSRIYSIVANPRPFVRTAVYFGPDRRRRMDDPGPDDRRQNAGLPDAPRAPAGQALTQTEINILFNP